MEGLTYTVTKTYLFAVSEGVLRSISKQEIEVLNKHVARIDSLAVNDATKMQLFAMRIVEVTGLELFVSFAKAARVNLGDENLLATKQRATKLKKLSEVKALLSENNQQ